MTINQTTISKPSTQPLQNQGLNKDSKQISQVVSKLTDQKNQVCFNKNASKIKFQSPVIDGKIDGKKFSTWGAKVKYEEPKEIPKENYFTSSALYKYCTNNENSTTLNKVWRQSLGWLSVYPLEWITQNTKLGWQNTKPHVTNYFRRRWNFDKNLEYVGLKEEESKKVHELLKNLWNEYKNTKKVNFPIEDVASMYIKVFLKDGKPDLNGKFTFIVKVKQKGKDGSYKNGEFETKTKEIVRGYFSDDNPKDTCKDLLMYIGEAIECSDFSSRQTYTPEEFKKFIKENELPFVTPKNVKNNSIENSSSKQLTANDCWLHAGIKGLLLNTKIMEQLNTYEKNKIFYENRFKTKINNNWDALSPIEKEKYSNQKNNYTEVRKQILNKTQSLRECLQKCQKNPDDTKTIISSYSEKIRRETQTESSTSQEDASLLTHRLIKHFLDDLELPISKLIQVTETIQEWNNQTLVGDKIEKKITGQDDSIELNLQPYKDNTELQAFYLINNFFNDDNCDEIKEFKLNENDPTKTWKILNKRRRFNSEPEGNVSFYINRFKYENSIFQKINTLLKNVPLELNYQDQQFKLESGPYKFKYAIIHEGEINGGHYYTIYKENDKWFLYDYGTTTEISKEKSIKFLENAVYLHYEKQ